MPFFVRIQGSNAVNAYCYGSAGARLTSSGNGGEVYEQGEGGRRAIFSTRDEAASVGLACRWNGQTYTVHSCREDKGVLVPPQSWRSCQEAYGR
jgi:hypothetical protein